MIDTVLNRQVTFLMLFIAIMIVGVIAFLKIPVELMPNASFGEISIIHSVRGGIPPDKIENFVTKPVEEAVGGVGNLNDIVSISEEGRSTVVLKFAAGADMNIATMEVRESLSQVKNKLPREVEKPIVAQYEQEDIPIMMIGVTSPLKTPEGIRKVVDEEMKERLSRIQGVANVDVFGGRERKIIVEVLPDKLQSYTMAMSDIINSLNRSNVSILSGGVESSDSDFTIKATGRFEKISDIENLGVAVGEEGSIIRLKDVADIKDSYMEAENISRLDTNANVTVYIQKETLGSTVEICRDVLIEIEEIRKVVQKDIIVSVIKNDSIFINKAIASMQESLILGGLLAAGVLLLFLRSFSLTLINFFTIPLSVMLAVTLLFFNKVSLNVMTLGGLALGVGMLLDNSIVVIENIFRAYEELHDRRRAIVEGTGQIILPIIASTLTTIVVFLPIVFMSEDLKQTQGGMALTITYSLVASLFIALTLIPLLFYKFRIEPKKTMETGAIAHWYRIILALVVKFRLWVLGTVAIIFAIAMLFFMKIDMNLFDAEEENKFTIHVELPTGAKIEVSDEKVTYVEDMLRALPEVKQVSSKIEKWSSKIYVTLIPSKDRERSKADIIASLRPRFKEVQPAFIYFKESQALSAKEVFVDLFGNDYKMLKKLATDVGGYIKAVPGLQDVKIRMREGRPEKIVILDRKAVALSGFTISSVSENIHARLRGLVATRYHDKAAEIETIVRQDRKTFKDFTDIYGLTMMNEQKHFIQLAQVAEFKDGKGPSEIWRKNKRRFVQVSASREKISLEKAADAIKANLKNMKFPDNYFFEIGGDYEKMMRSKKELYTALALTVILVYLVLGSLFESYTQPFIIMLSVPLAMIGVVITLKVTKNNISTGVITGIIMLAGIVVNNAIMLIDRINGLKESNTKDYVVEGSVQRLRPIMMTVSTTILGLLPLALRGGEGSGMWKPLSLTVIGGLMSSTILVLFIVPCVYMMLDRQKGTMLE